VILVAQAPVQFQRGVIPVIDFEVDGVYTHLASALGYELHGLAAQSFSPVLRLDVQFIDKCFASVILKTKTQREHDVPGRPLLFENKPNSAKLRVGQKLV